LIVIAKKPLGEDGEDVEPEDNQAAADMDDGEKKKPTFKVEEYKWTVTDRNPKNLPQLFMQSKGIGARHERQEVKIASAQTVAEGLSPS